MLPFRTLLILACLLHASATRAGAFVGNDYLAATFNDQPLNMQIGTGGAALGQPVSISGGLQAFVVPPGLFATPSLRITPLASGAARFVRFEFLDSREITTGEVHIGFVLRPAQLDRFLVYVREQEGSANDFMSMTLFDSGGIAVSDAANPGAVVIGSYSAGALLVFDLRFDLENDTYDIILNGAALVTDRSHGISANGIGSILLGTDPSSTLNTSWFVEDLYAYRPDAVFRGGFEE